MSAKKIYPIISKTPHSKQPNQPIKTKLIDAMPREFVVAPKIVYVAVPAKPFAQLNKDLEFEDSSFFTDHHQESTALSACIGGAIGAGLGSLTLALVTLDLTAIDWIILPFPFLAAMAIGGSLGGLSGWINIGLEKEDNPNNFKES